MSFASGGNSGAWTVSASPWCTRQTPSAWKPMTTATSDARAAQAMTNGMVARSGSSGPWVAMITSFSWSAMSRLLSYVVTLFR